MTGCIKNSGDARLPLVYALTSEMDEEMIVKIRKAGFKAIYHMLDQVMLREIKMNAGLVFNSECGPVIDKHENSIIWGLRGNSKELLNASANEDDDSLKSSSNDSENLFHQSNESQ